MSGHREQVGSMATEAGLLIDVVLERLQKVTTPDPATVCTECGRAEGVRCSTGCPWCAVVAVVKGEPADIPAPVVESVTTALTAVRSWLAGAASGTAPATQEQDVPSSADHPSGPPTMQRIDITP